MKFLTDRVSGSLMHTSMVSNSVWLCDLVHAGLPAGGLVNGYFDLDGPLVTLSLEDWLKCRY